jgi:Cellulase (glycosyl hydrolase family 5)
MNPALRKVIAFALLALALAPAASAGAAKGPLGGINIPGLAPGSQPAEADPSIALARKLHAKIVRVELPWSVLEPEGPALDPGALAFTDRLVNDAAADGIKVSVVVDKTPCWASSAPAPILSACNPHSESQADAWPPTDPSTYAAVLAALAHRYGNKLAAIEVWNEPDQSNEDYFAGPEKPANYAKLLRAAYPAVKAVDPSLPVLGGSLVGSNGAFLRALYAAGIKGYYDGLSVHYYHLTLASLRSIREVQVANGDTKPLWLDEFGWTSCWPEHSTEQEQACVTPKTQAANLRNSIREMARVPYVAAALVYKLQDSKNESFGALSLSGKRKPAFDALSEAFQNPLGRFAAVTLSLRRHGTHLLASGSAPVGDFMELEAFRGKKLRYRALFTLNRFNSYSIALPSALGTHGLRVKVYQYWAGTKRAAQRST